MKVGFRVIWLLLMSFAVSASHAAPTWHVSTIKRVYPQADGSVVVVFDVDSPACTNGNTPNYHAIAAGQNGVNSEGLKNIYALLIASATSGHSVTINFDDSTPSCYISRIYVEYSS